MGREELSEKRGLAPETQTSDCVSQKAEEGPPGSPKRLQRTLKGHSLPSDGTGPTLGGFTSGPLSMP